ncbi:MAG TPA: LamG domain-containing protein, partial [Bryobacteraceae bacterium]|nr:LamG domain-containing protein [Bryobacteraceae bacterium]
KSYVRVLNSPSLHSDTVTVEAWVQGRAPQGPFRYLLAKGVHSEDAASYAFFTGRRSGGLAFYIFDGADAAISPDPGAGIWDGKWHHAAGTFDGATVRLYIDGKQVENGTPTALKIEHNLSTTNDLFIGTYLWPGIKGFIGSIDELSIYDRPLSPSEIEQIYRAGSAGKSNGP